MQQSYHIINSSSVTYSNIYQQLFHGEAYCAGVNVDKMWDELTFSYSLFVSSSVSWGWGEGVLSKEGRPCGCSALLSLCWSSSLGRVTRWRQRKVSFLFLVLTLLGFGIHFSWWFSFSAHYSQVEFDILRGKNTILRTFSNHWFAILFPNTTRHPRGLEIQKFSFWTEVKFLQNS